MGAKTLYTIDQLKWDNLNISSNGFMSYSINKREDRQEWESKYTLSYCRDEYYDEGIIDADSIKDAKEKAEKDWHERIKGVLTPAK